MALDHSVRTNLENGMRKSKGVENPSMTIMYLRIPESGILNEEMPFQPHHPPFFGGGAKILGIPKMTPDSISEWEF